MWMDDGSGQNGGVRCGWGGCVDGVGVLLRVCGGVVEMMWRFLVDVSSI